MLSIEEYRKKINFFVEKLDRVTDESQNVVLNNLLDFVNNLPFNDDRAVIILGCAQLDNRLEVLLKTLLTSVPEKKDSLFNGYSAPLGSFAVKIDLAARLGLISTDTERILDAIRDIRNDFAHNVDVRTLQLQSYRDKINFMVNTLHSSNFLQVSSYYKKLNDGLSNSKMSQELKQFFIIFVVILFFIETAIIVNTRIEVDFKIAL